MIEIDAIKSVADKFKGYFFSNNATLKMENMMAFYEPLMTEFHFADMTFASYISHP